MPIRKAAGWLQGFISKSDVDFDTATKPVANALQRDNRHFQHLAVCFLEDY